MAARPHPGPAAYTQAFLRHVGVASHTAEPQHGRHNREGRPPKAHKSRLKERRRSVNLDFSAER